MSNNTAGNPLYYDGTSGATWKGTKYVRLFQWVDLNEDIIDGDQCTFTVNGVTLDVEVQKTTDVGWQAPVAWQIGPFNPGIAWSDFTLSAMDSGAVHIWID